MNEPSAWCSADGGNLTDYPDVRDELEREGIPMVPLYTLAAAAEKIASEMEAAAPKFGSAKAHGGTEALLYAVAHIRRTYKETSDE